MEQIKITYVVIDRAYLKTCGSSMRTFKWSRHFDDLMNALNYVLNSGKEDCIIVPMPKDQFNELYERNERLCI